MVSILCAALLVTACLIALWPRASGAQVRCPEGKTASGACVNVPLADSMRETAIILSQPKLSYTAYPVLPSSDWQFRYPNQLVLDPLSPSSVGVPLPPPSN